MEWCGFFCDQIQINVMIFALFHGQIQYFIRLTGGFFFRVVVGPTSADQQGQNIGRADWKFDLGRKGHIFHCPGCCCAACCLLLLHNWVSRYENQS
jgi:hypothetical protein